MRITKSVNLLLCLLLFLFAGCATIIHGADQNVIVTSDPIHANLTVDNMRMGQTPNLVKLSRKDKHIIKVELNGYEPYETMLKPRLDGWIVGNIIFGGIIGIAIDAVSGSMYKLSQKDVYAKLTTQSSSVSVKDGVYINVVFKVDKSWQKIGTLTKVDDAILP